jgi:hypothetical protein
MIVDHGGRSGRNADDGVKPVPRFECAPLPMVLLAAIAIAAAWAFKACRRWGKFI